MLYPRATLNGIDQSGPSSKRPRNGHYGQLFYDEDMARLMVHDCRGRGLFGADGALVNDLTAASLYVADHFKAATINAAYDVTAGIDAQAVAFAFDSTVKAGAVKATTGNAGDGAANDAVTLSIDNPMQVGASGKLEFSVGLTLSAVLNCYFFIGFTDVLPGTTLELPITLSTATFTTTATDAVGFMFDTAATLDTVRLTGVKTDVDAAHVNTGFVPVLDTMYDFHIRLEGSTAYFSIDGVTFTGVNNLALAVATDVDLYPIVVVCPRTTTSIVAKVDFLRAGKF